jgi:hypothetical protein
MAIAMMGGVIAATVLTLTFLPALYALAFRVRSSAVPTYVAVGHGRHRTIIDATVRRVACDQPLRPQLPREAVRGRFKLVASGRGRITADSPITVTIRPPHGDFTSTNTVSDASRDGAAAGARLPAAAHRCLPARPRLDNPEAEQRPARWPEHKRNGHGSAAVRHRRSRRWTVCWAPG